MNAFRFARDVLALGQEWDVNPATTGTILALQLLAMEAGCSNPDEGLAWAVERGLVARREDVPEDDPHAWEITAEGEAAACRRLGLPEPDRS